MIMNAENLGIESKVRVKSGDLAAKGKGKVAIVHTSGGQYRVGISLPDAAGVCQPLDLTSIERVELVKTKPGWFSKGGWIKPLVVTTVTAILLKPVYLGVFMYTFDLLDMVVNWVGEQIVGGGYLLLTMLGPIHATGVYTGTKLTRLARFIVTTQDGKHAVLEGPESVFHFISGIYAAPNIEVETVASGTPLVPSGDPQPASA